MQEFSSISVSSYEASALADRLTEHSSDGWTVVAIVPTGSTVTAYLSRSTSGDVAPSAGADDGAWSDGADGTPESIDATSDHAGSNDLDGGAAPEGAGGFGAVTDSTDTTESPGDHDAASPSLPATGVGTTAFGTTTDPDTAADTADRGASGWGASTSETTSEQSDTGWSSSTTDVDDTAAGTATPDTTTTDVPVDDIMSDTSTDNTTDTATDTSNDAASASAAPAGWYADPSARFELRYWDGGQWTEHVSRSGQQYTDPPVA